MHAADDRAIVVVDLDGTLIPGNSFRAWMRHLTGWALLHGRPGIVVRMLALAAGRARGRLDHAGLKRGVLLLSSEVPPEVADRFGRRLVRQVRPELWAAVTQDADGRDVVLVTAAPALYLQQLGEELGAAAVIATPGVVDDAWRETVGQAKLDALMERFGTDVEIDVVYTDHPDDLPLVTRAHRAVIVHPRAEHWPLFERSGTPVTRMEVSG
jgi:phosphoserine phosphatase